MGLDAFRDDREPQCVAEADDGGDGPAVFARSGRRHDPQRPEIAHRQVRHRCLNPLW